MDTSEHHPNQASQSREAAFMSCDRDASWVMTSHLSSQGENRSGSGQGLRVGWVCGMKPKDTPLRVRSSDGLMKGGRTKGIICGVRQDRMIAKRSAR